MKRIVPLTALAAGVGLLCSGALAAPVGTVLFSQAGSQIVGANGVPRAAQRGDVLQHGEKLKTPSGGIAQVLMLDGSILGVRPDTELRFEPPVGNAPTAVSLLQGSVRAIASELMDSKRPSAMTLMSGQATLRLKGGDVESTVVDEKQRQGVDAGSYNRLITGDASIGKGSVVEPLSPRQVSFVGSTALAPVTLTTVSPDLFGSKLALPVGGALDTSKTTILSASEKPVLVPLTSTVLNTTSLGTVPKTTVVLQPLPPPPPKIVILAPPVTLQPPRLPNVTCTLTRC